MIRIVMKSSNLDKDGQDNSIKDVVKNGAKKARFTVSRCFK